MSLTLDADMSRQDFFSIVVGPMEMIEATVTFSTADGDVDLALQDTNGVVLDSSVTTGPTDTIEWQNNSTSFVEVFLRAYLFSPDAGDCLPYQLEYSTTTGVCVDDSREEDDSSPLATFVDVPDNASQSFSGVANDADWFFLNADNGEAHTVTLTYAASSSVLLEHYSASTFNFVNGSYSGSGTETLSIGSGQDALLRIVPNGSECDPYTLTISSL